MDVLAVEGRDEAAIESLDNPADRLVAGVFLVPQIVAALRHAVPLRDQGHELGGGPGQDRSHLVEHIKELHRPWQQAESHRQGLSMSREISRHASRSLHEWYTLLSYDSRAGQASCTVSWTSAGR